ncbi:MAG TPA: ABC transporter permease [Blastocatellia bacterium]|jgi:putative ABC transport system permease protein|nr:ABC transporter permease [Blastocatellia bacterium]
MDNLVLSNIRQRPTRTLISTSGVALGVILIILMTGLARGMLNDRIRREKGVGAEVQFFRIGGGTLSAGNAMPLDVRYAERLKKISGVRLVSPYGHYVQTAKTGLGFEMVDAIELDAYSEISGLRIVEGRAFQSDDEVIVDEFKAQRSNLRVGSAIQVFGKTMTVVGIYGPEIGSRIKMSLGALQRALSQENKCLGILIKVEDGVAPEEVARRIDAELPGNRVLLTSDIGINFGSQVPGIKGFIRAVMGLSTVVSSLVILLAMYTTITERTREIGILKSLGASKAYIIGVIEKEAIAISLIGIVAGLAVALAVGSGIERTTSLRLEFHWTWILTAALIGLGAGAIGALYPAVRAANQDAVKALSYE